MRSGKEFVRQGRAEICTSGALSSRATSILCLALLASTAIAFSIVAWETTWTLLADALRAIRGF